MTVKTTSFDHEYYVMVRDQGEYKKTLRCITFRPHDKRTDSIVVADKEEAISHSLLFEASLQDERIKAKWPGEIGDISGSGGGFLIKEWVWDILKFVKPKDMMLYPSVYIDVDGKYHEPLWYLDFFQGTDCWHRERSELDVPYDPNIDTSADVVKFSLDEKVLAPIPLEDRLLFKIRKTIFLPTTFVHESIVEQLQAKGCKGVAFFKVAEYTEGMESL